jgi:transcriptional regulator with XRE-family HTH domain
MNYRDAIIKLRVKLNLSQQELAEKLGVSFMSINRWENGKTEPTIIAREKLKAMLSENNIVLEEKSDGRK